MNPFPVRIRTAGSTAGSAAGSAARGAGRCSRTLRPTSRRIVPCFRSRRILAVVCRLCREPRWPRGSRFTFRFGSLSFDKLLWARWSGARAGGACSGRLPVNRCCFFLFFDGLF